MAAAPSEGSSSHNPSRFHRLPVHHARGVARRWGVPADVRPPWPANRPGDLGRGRRYRGTGHHGYEQAPPLAHQAQRPGIQPLRVQNGSALSGLVLLWDLLYSDSVGCPCGSDAPMFGVRGDASAAAPPRPICTAGPDRTDLFCPAGRPARGPYCVLTPGTSAEGRAHSGFVRSPTVSYDAAGRSSRGRGP
jgi:hypothetical protein